MLLSGSDCTVLGGEFGICCLPRSGMQHMNLSFSYTQLLGELEESGLLHRSFPRLVGLDLEGCKGQCWAGGDSR